jgi:hypothetical protein
MSAQGRTVDGAARLREALERLAGALAEPSLDALLESEAALASAVAALSPGSVVAPGERALVRDELLGARRALLRCRRLGAALAEVVRIGVEARGAMLDYRTPGSGVSPVGSSIDTRG